MLSIFRHSQMQGNKLKGVNGGLVKVCVKTDLNTYLKHVHQISVIQANFPMLCLKVQKKLLSCQKFSELLMSCTVLKMLPLLHWNSKQCCQLCLGSPLQTIPILLFSSIQYMAEKFYSFSIENKQWVPSYTEIFQYVPYTTTFQGTTTQFGCGGQSLNLL